MRKARSAAALKRVEQDLQGRIAAAQAELDLNRQRLDDQAELLQQSQRILAETQTDALQAGKLAALGQMAAGICMKSTSL